MTRHSKFMAGLKTYKGELARELRGEVISDDEGGKGKRTETTKTTTTSGTASTESDDETDEEEEEEDDQSGTDSDVGQSQDSDD